MSGNDSSTLSPRGGPFFIQIVGLPERFTWKDLKDAIRPVATHGVWTDSKTAIQGDREITRHLIKVKLEREARAAYTYLCQRGLASRKLLVELWDITESPPIGLSRNYDPSRSGIQIQRQEVERIAQDNSCWKPTSTGYPTHTLMQLPQMSPQQPYAMQYRPTELPMPPTPPAGQISMAEYRQYQFAAQQQAAQYAAYTNTSGLPVNMTNGVAVTENRAVFVSKLKYETKESELAHLFGKVGTVLSCKIQKDSTRKSKGNATVEYKSAQDAARAIQQFDGYEFKGMRLQVRLDKDQTTVAAPSSRPDRQPARPLIVNGSNSNRTRRNE